MFPFYKKHNLGVIARVPLDEGGLSGKVNPATVFDDWRDNFFKGDRRREVLERTKKLMVVIDDEAADLPELSLRWVLSHPEISTVIPGMRAVAHARQNCDVSDGRLLSENLMRELKNHVWERNFYQ